MFSAGSSSASGGAGEGCSGGSSMPSTSSEAGKTRGQFKYIVDWDDVPLPITRALDRAEENGERAHPTTIDKLRTWVGKDLVRKYGNFRSTHIVRTKTPGIEVYRDITTQIITNKYKKSFRVETNGIVLDEDGYESFLKKFQIMIDNRGRPLPNVQKSATIAKGAVVARSSQFNPDLTIDEKKTQKQMRDRLQEIFHTCRESIWPHNEIDELMSQSYSLQRMDIVSYGIMLDESEEQEQEEVEGPPKEALTLCVARVKADWPFLFQPKWQALHYLQLTDNPIDLACEEFIEQQLDVLVKFLTSSNSDTAMKCLALKSKWEQASSRAATKFMMAMKMVAFYFREDSTSFFLPAERTTSPTEVQLLPGITGSPTIVALNQNIFLANKFYVCIDQQVIRETYSSDEAMQAIIQGAFIFSTEYNNQMKHTFEYIERIVCQLGSSSQLKKPLRVASTVVLKLVNAVQKFDQRLKKMTESI